MSSPAEFCSRSDELTHILEYCQVIRITPFIYFLFTSKHMLVIEISIEY